MSLWCPDWELERLLQACEEETLAADDKDLKRALAEARVSEAWSLRQVAGLVRAAVAEYEEPDAEAAPRARSRPRDQQARWPH